MMIRENVPISSLTTMRLGGNARYVIEITDPQEIPDAYLFASEKGLPTYVIGGGSNIIGTDEGFDGVIILNKIVGIEQIDDDLNDDETVIRAHSGTEFDEVCEFASKRGYTGIEALSLIPGSIGGAVMQNSGAYGQQLSDTLTEIKVYDTQEKKFTTLTNKDLNLSYRRSLLNTTARGRYFVVSATIKLRKGEIEGELFESLQNYLNKKEIEERTPLTIRRAVIDIRSKKLPDPDIQASAGSFFKNYTIDESQVDNLRKKYPEIPIFKIGDTTEIASGWLIEQCGLKGQVLHGMKVSDKTALVLINESARSYADLANARQMIIDAVREKFGFTLTQEPEEL